eukprot:scaffold847_cov385-Prasinococcus_capsulatus_cf.AAC.13
MSPHSFPGRCSGFRGPVDLAAVQSRPGWRGRGGRSVCIFVRTLPARQPLEKRARASPYEPSPLRPAHASSRANATAHVLGSAATQQLMNE